MKVTKLRVVIAVLITGTFSFIGCEEDKSLDLTGDIGTLTDNEGNTYDWIGIGTQIWMAENLKTTTYNDGTSIDLISDEDDWEYTTSGAYCRTSSVYGTLYNGYAATSRKLCPDGWHVPSDEEWTTLENYLTKHGHRGTEGKALKSTSGWENNGNGSDNFGFTALPSGFRQSTGHLGNTGTNGSWWSDTESKNIRALLDDGCDTVVHRNEDMTYGGSVRCVKGSGIPLAAFSVDTTEIKGGESVSFTDNSTRNPQSWLWDFGDGTSATEQNPTHTYDSLGIFTISLTVSNTYGSDTKTLNEYLIVSNIDYGSVTDYDGNIYLTVNIGTQTWMAKNLKVTTYNDGNPINYVSDADDWITADAAYCYYDNNKTLCDSAQYGALYNHNALETGKLCPTGWHVATEAEWTTLEKYIINDGHEDYGTTLKAGSGWNSDENFVGKGTNDYGFSALPGGHRYNKSGNFDKAGYSGWWWCGDDAVANNKEASICHLNYSQDFLLYSSANKLQGMSVRCIKDSE